MVKEGLMKWRGSFFYVMILLAACQDGAVVTPEAEMPIKFNAFGKAEQNDSTIEVVLNEDVNNEYEQLINSVSCEPECHVSLQAIESARRIKTLTNQEEINRSERFQRQYNRDYLDSLSSHLNLHDFTAFYKFDVTNTDEIIVPNNSDDYLYSSNDVFSFTSINDSESLSAVLLPVLLNELETLKYIQITESVDGRVRSFKVIKDLNVFSFQDKRVKLKSNEVLWRVPFFKHLNLRPDSVVRANALDTTECKYPKTFYKAAFEPIGFWGNAIFNGHSEIYFSGCDQYGPEAVLWGQDRVAFRIEF